MGASPSHIPTPTVLTSTGSVSGKAFSVEGNRLVDAYLGIPYAKPPVGSLRFKNPEPIDKWEGVRECRFFGPRCPQKDEYLSQFLNIVGKDESRCLTVNVIAPRWKSEKFPKGLPVMVWIHGGGFTVHSSSNYGDSTVARNLCVNDVVFASINYRLGIFGFFTTGDEICRGNMGLWDQTLALKWLKENISAFGGDPENMTIFGQSAGGASVDLLSLSPQSRDLFKRVIAMAGTAENDFALRSKEAQAQMSRDYARYLGWNGEDDDSVGLIEWISKQSAARLELGMGIKKDFRNPQSGGLYFVPNFDGEFFPKTLYDLRLEMPKREVMTGTTAWEGLFFAALSNIPTNSVHGLEKIAGMAIKPCDYGEEFSQLRKKVVEFYAKPADGDKRKLCPQVVKCFGDAFICNGVANYANRMASLGHTVYLYSFDYFNPDGFGLFRFLLPFKGPTHCTEIRYILGKGVISKFRPNEEDMKMIHIMTTYFTNFAKYGNPNGENSSQKWEPHSVEYPFRHLQITLAPKMTDDYQDRRSEFWNEHVYSRLNLAVKSIRDHCSKI